MMLNKLQGDVQEAQENYMRKMMGNQGDADFLPDSNTNSTQQTAPQKDVEWFPKDYNSCIGKAQKQRSVPAAPVQNPWTAGGNPWTGGQNPFGAMGGGNMQEQM